MTYVVVGATGLLGRHLSRLLASRRLPRVLFGYSAASWNGRVSRIDIRDPGAVETAIRRAAPRVVINAAYDKADWQTTAVGPGNLARACERHGARLVHISSDAVFSGRELSYDESSVPDPVTKYGAAKAAAETAIAMYDNAAIVRTSWLVGGGMSLIAPAAGGEGRFDGLGTPFGSTIDGAPGIVGGRISPFEQFVRDVATGDAEGALYTDDIATPLHAADLASAVLEIAGQDLAGTIHVAGREPMSRHELATEYARWAGLDPDLLPRGRRYGDDGPVAVRLDSSMAGRVLRTRIRPIDEVYRA